MMTQKYNSKQFLKPALLAAALLLLAMAVVTGCGTTSGGTGGFASVRIQNHGPDDISATTCKVFGENGYRGGMTGSGEMVFEKAASKATSYSREGLVGGFYGAQTINRVKVGMVPLAGGNTIRLECKAYLVSGGSDPFFQNEAPLATIRSGPYQKMLNKVAKQLQ